jgi:hypothetical protein
MAKSKEQRRLEALDRRERDLRFAVRERAACYPYGAYARLAQVKMERAQSDVQSLRRKLGIRDEEAA